MADLATLAIQVTSNGMKQASTELNNLEKASLKAEKSAQSLANCVGRLTRILELSGVGIGIKALFDVADKMKSMENQVRFATKSVEEFNQVQQQLFGIAQNTRASLESTTQLYVRASQAVKSYGYSQQQVLKFTETINKAMAVGGVGAQEQASALLQLSQALGSGKLQGDEFRSIAEAAPIILDTLSTYLGKSREEVKKLATEGKLTSKIIFEAFAGGVKDIEAKFTQMPISFGGAMQQLQNAAMKTVADLDSAFKITQSLGEAISFLAKNTDYLVSAGLIVLVAHLGKYVTTATFAKIQTHQQAVANLEVARTTHQKAAAELAAAQANMRALTASMALAQSEKTRIAIRAQIAQQAKLITALANGEATAMRNLAAATGQASIAKNAATVAANGLRSAMALLGGPAGVIMLAAGALFYFYQKSKEAEQAALDTEAANQRLNQSYQNLSQAKLADTLREQIALMKNYEEQIQSIYTQISTLQTSDGLAGFYSESTLKELDELNDKLKQIQENKNIDFSVLKNQLTELGLKFVEGGQSLDAFRDKAQLMGVSAEMLNEIMNEQSFQISAVEAQFRAMFPQIDSTKISYDGLTISVGNFSIAADIASAKALQLSGALGTIVKTALMAAGAVANLNGVAGGVDSISDEAAKMIKRNSMLMKIAELERKGDKKGANKVKAEMQLEGVEMDEASRAAVIQSYESLYNSQDLTKEHRKGKKEKNGNDWKNYLNELERANADGLARIALEQDRSMREMLEKAKKAGASHAEIEKAKMLITERYAKERMEIAEKYVPSLKFEEELKDQIKEIDELQKLNLITTEQASLAKEALAGKYQPVVEIQQQYINQLREIEALKQAGVLSKPQAEVAAEKAKWDAGTQKAKIAGKNAVSPYEKWKSEFDPMQAIQNEQASKLAEVQSMYDQHLIQYEDFINAKAQIDAKATADTHQLFMNSISGFGSAIDTMLGVMKNAGQEQSGIYRTMFAMSKAFAIAESILNLNRAITQAMSDQTAITPAQKFANMAAIASAGASLISNIQSVSLGGMAHSGIDNVPKEGTWLLDKGERVVDSRTNQDLKTFLSNANRGGASGQRSAINVKIINNGQPVEAKVSSEETVDGNIQMTVELLKKMDQIADQRYRRNQLNDLRTGGTLSK
ncbi:tape measure protein [Mannheimia haemolytica]|uniref:tape measure protein n=1 Tax=Mannheimia haemolytica TaxID=75985 RepID=UPI001377AFF8|nr:tape measure protein [Mannheimia haemolytica]NBB68662.1 tape measure protein [Mannheimia haemolytica]